MDIVKVQIPLFSTEDLPRVLVYPQARKPYCHQTITQETATALGEDYKGYFEAEYDRSNRVWIIGRRVADQLW